MRDGGRGKPVFGEHCRDIERLAVLRVPAGEYMRWRHREHLRPGPEEQPQDRRARALARSELPHEPRRGDFLATGRVLTAPQRRECA